jgi:excisionase family DNA binding protein
MANDNVEADDPRDRPPLKPYIQRKPPPSRRQRRQPQSAQAKRSILGPKWDGRDSFTVEEAGEILGLSRWAAYQAASNGNLPVVRVGHRLIVPRHALEKLLDVSVPA